MRDLWPQQQLANILADIIDYRGKAPPKSDSGVQLITARNVRPGRIDLSHKEFIPESEYDSWMNRGLPSAGDILFTTEAPLGNACMYPANGKFAVGQRIVTLRPKHELMNSNFLCCFLQSEEGQTRISFRSTGSTAKGIKARELVKIFVPVPPLEHQRKIAEILQTWDRAIDATDRLIAAKQARLTAIPQRSDRLVAGLSHCSRRARRKSCGIVMALSTASCASHTPTARWDFRSSAR
jgi:type I restriction enzyme, S subunit